MKRKSLYWGMLSLMFVASCANEEVVEVNNGPEIAFSTRMTRADVINSVADLQEFKVYAKSKGYNTFWLIDGETAKYKTAVPDNASRAVFSMENTYHWPSDVSNIEFWAFSPEDVAFSTDTKSLAYTPAYYDKDNVKNSGGQQKDLIFAYTNADRSQASSVALNFEHMLSQIEVKAYNASKNATSQVKNSYNVSIKGAWIVNAKNEAILSRVDDKNVWTFQDSPTVSGKIYGYEFVAPKEIEGSNVNLLSNGDNKKGDNLMLIPQTLNYWDLATDKTINEAKGAYILLLCRIEVKHEGALHQNDGNAQAGTDGYVKTYDNDGTFYHVHQMFPTGSGNGYNDKEYGYVAVQISDATVDGKKMKWEAGKKYTYVLEFCGHTSGAGLYPPAGYVEALNLPTTGDDGYTYVSKIPTSVGKEEGDPVLDSPIQFTVSVEPWDGSWTNGNLPMN